jgi:hypothetical protein
MYEMIDDSVLVIVRDSCAHCYGAWALELSDTNMNTTQTYESMVNIRLHPSGYLITIDNNTCKKFPSQY